MADVALGLNLLLEVGGDASGFGFTVTPAFDSSDLAKNIAVNTSANSYDVFYMLGVGYILQPTYISQDTKVQNWTCSAADGQGAIASPWVNGFDTETGRLNIFQTDSTDGIRWYASMDEMLTVNSCGWLKVGRGMVSGDDEVNTDIYIGASATFDPDNPGASPIHISLQYDTPPTVYFATPTSYTYASGGSSWNYATGAVSKMYAKSQDLFKGDRLVDIAWWSFPGQNCIVIYIAGEYLLLNGAVYATINSGGSTVIQNNTNLTIAAGGIEIYGYNGTAQIGYYGMAYAQNGYINVGPTTLSFVYGGNGVMHFPKSSQPTNTSIVGYLGLYPGDVSQSGLEISYQVQLNGSGFNTPVMPEAQVHIPAVTINTSLFETTNFTESQITEVEEHQWEDITNASTDGNAAWDVRTEVYMKFQNYSGMFAGVGGKHYCCQYSRNLSYFDQDSQMMLPLSNPIVYLTGYLGDTSDNYRQNNNKSFHITLRDKMWALGRASSDDSQRFYDGVCIYAVMKDQLQRSGVTDQYINTNDDNGFYNCTSAPNDPNCTHFKLGIGTAQSPLCAFDPEAKYLENINWLAGQLHEILWLDPYGVYNRTPYNTWMLNARQCGAFTPTQQSDPMLQGFGMWVSQLKLESDTYNRRTSVTTIGLNPQTLKPSVAKLSIDSMAGFGPGWTAKIHGFNDPLISVNKLYCDPNTQNVVTQAMMRRAMVPDVYFNGLYAFLPNMYVYDQYSVSEYTPVAGVGGFVLPMGVTLPLTLIDRVGVYQNCYDIDGTIKLFSQMRGRYTPNNF